jgi:hypothetical protein
LGRVEGELFDSSHGGCVSFLGFGLKRRYTLFFCLLHKIPYTTVLEEALF